jgi:threonine aldolase
MIELQNGPHKFFINLFMSKSKNLISLGSDNHSGVHPQILESLLSIKEKYAPSYDTDPDSQELKKWLQKNWQVQDSHLVFNGTAANVLGISAALQSHHAVLCSDVSHLNVDECGAPEKWTGCKLIPIPHVEGKIPLSNLKSYLTRRGDQHSNQVKMISITQPTELGTVYSLSELQLLRDFCDREKLYLHIDGARLGNACYNLRCNFVDILKFADVASVGGTKNGLLFGELVILNRPEFSENFKYLRKQAMQLPSKTRFLAKSFLTYLTTGLWREIAQHQCDLAAYLADEILKNTKLSLNYPVQSNGVFCCLPQAWIKPLRQEFFFYVWNEQTFECRLMTSFCTSKEEIDQFVAKLKTLA